MMLSNFFRRTLLFGTVCCSVCSAENVVLKEDFDTAENKEKWTLSSFRNGNYFSDAGWATEKDRNILLLQDFDYSDAAAEAVSPAFRTGDAWSVTYDFSFAPPSWGKEKQPYAFRAELLAGDGSVIADFGASYLRLVPGGFLPGKIPVKDNRFYRLSAVCRYNDGTYDLKLTDLTDGSVKEVSELPLKSVAKPERFRFRAIPGRDTSGVLRVDNFSVSDLGRAEKRVRPQIGRMENDRLILRFCKNGCTEIDFRNSPDGSWSSLGAITAPEVPGCPSEPVSFRTVKLLDDNPKLPKINFEMIPTATDMVGSGNQVLGVAALDGEGKQLYLMQWTLFPEGARCRVYPTWEVSQEWEKNLASVQLRFDPKFKEHGRFSPERYYLHRTGGEPEELNRGQAIEFGDGVNFVTFAAAGQSPTYWRFYENHSLNFETKRCRLPWAPTFYCGTLAFSVRGNADSRVREAIARAGDERLLMEVKSPDRFFLLKEPGEYRLTAYVGNYFRKPTRIHLKYTARNFNGDVLKTEHLSQVVPPGAEAVFPLCVNLTEVGPVFFDIYASNEFGGDYRRVCGGVLPELKFKAGKESRIGVTGWRDNPGETVERRSSGEVLDMMKRIGITTIRQSYRYESEAQQKGFRTWYHNNIGDSASLERYIKDGTSWLADPKAIRHFLKGNLEHTRKTGSEVLELTNEWNLYGGEQNAVRAKAHADFTKILREVRDQYYPEIKLTGLTICNGDMPYMRTIYDNGAWDDFDYLAVHTAGVNRSPETDDSYWSFMRTLRAVREALRRYGDKPVYITEHYAATAPNMQITNNERISADDLAISVGLAVALDAKCIMYYVFNDFENRKLKNPNVNLDVLREHHFGLFHRDWMPKLTLWAYQTAARFFDPGEFLGDLNFSEPGARGLLFDKGPDGEFALLWSRKGGLRQQEAIIDQGFNLPPWQPADVAGPVEIRLKPRSGNSIRVTTVMGHTYTMEAGRDGNVVLSLTESPVYVENADLKPVKGAVYRMLSPKAAPEEWIRMTPENSPGTVL